MSTFNNPPEGGFGLWYDSKVNRFFDDEVMYNTVFI